jgi:hypothetical protein
MKEAGEEDQLDGWTSQGAGGTGNGNGNGGAAEQITSWEKGSFN